MIKMLSQDRKQGAIVEDDGALIGRLFARSYILSILLLTIGVILCWWGGQLWALGGSPYYLLAGVATAASGLLVGLGNRLGATVYGAMLLVTIAWAIWEAGFNGWALTARLAAPTVLGIWFLLPWTRRRLRGRPLLGWRGRALAILGMIALGAGLHAAVGQERLDPIFQAGVQAEPAAPEPGRAPAADDDWAAWGGTSNGTRFSALDQITPANVGKLELAWVYRFGPAPSGAPASLEATPLKVGGNLYLCNDYNDLVSVDAETGKQRWRFHAKTDLTGVPYGHCRGVAYYKVPNAAGFCAERIYTNTIDARLIAVDAATGRPCPGFGTNGIVSLMTGMSPAPKGYYIPTSAPTLARGRLVVGGWVSDGMFWGEPSGVIRAFDAVTGKLSWAFDVGNLERIGEPPAGEYYTPGTPNSWAPMSADDAMGLVFAPLGGASLDYASRQRRPYDNEWSSSLVALDAETGRPRWKFQTVHQDLWDYDVASQPSLIDYPTGNGTRPAVVQATKRGEIFVLDRATGKPLVPVTERRVPTQGAAPGERAFPTQPFSDALPSFRGPDVTEKSMWGITPLDQLWCRIKFREARYEGPLTPPGLTPSIAFPGFLGGSNWGGVSIDPDRGLMIVNSNFVANYTQMYTRAQADRMGVQPAGMGGEPKPEGVGVQPQAGTPYAVKAAPFLSLLYAPCQQPPWGKISAVDLKTRKLLWSHPIGTARDTGPLGLPSMLPFRIGTPNLGGSVTTRGGLIFIGATQDKYLRAIDTQTGKVLWRTRLAAASQSTPMTYMSSASGRQFVVIASGGHAFLGTKPGDALYAFALPRKAR